VVGTVGEKAKEAAHKGGGHMRRRWELYRELQDIPKGSFLSAHTLPTGFDVIAFDDGIDGPHKYLFCGKHESVCVA
jgi:hypothetical protein